MAKIKNVAVQMDDVAGINIAGDSAFAMSLEAQARGYTLFHYTPERLSLRDGKLYASVEPMLLRDVKGDHYSSSVRPNRADLFDHGCRCCSARIRPSTWPTSPRHASLGTHSPEDARCQ